MNITVLTFTGSNNSGSMLAGTNGGDVFRSTNIYATSGVNWTAISTGLTNKAVRALAVSGANIFAGTSGSGIFRSLDTGASWSTVNTGLTNMNVFALTFSGADVFAGTNGGGVFRTTNNGANWSVASTGLKGLNINSLIYSTNLFAATDSGVFMSTNKGASWTAVNTGLTNLHIRALAVLNSNLYAGNDNGVWRRPLSEMTTSIEKRSADSRNHFTFDANNSISFSLPSKSFVSLKAFDLSGKSASILLSEELTAGMHTRHLSTTALPNGLYFLRLETASFTETKKILLSHQAPQ